jgi:hypothetical protein
LAKLSDANQSIGRLETTVKDKERELVEERTRMQREIDRLKEMMQ